MLLLNPYMIRGIVFAMRFSLLEHSRLRPSVCRRGPVIVLDLFIALPFAQKSQPRLRLLKCDVWEIQGLVQIRLILALRAGVEKVPDVVRGLEVWRALGVFLKEVVVEGLEIGICGWCGERVCDDLRGVRGERF